MANLANPIGNQSVVVMCNYEYGNVSTPNRQIRFYLNPRQQTLSVAVHKIQQGNVVDPHPICQVNPQKITIEPAPRIPPSPVAPKVLGNLTFDEQCRILRGVTDKNIRDVECSPGQHHETVSSFVILF